MANMTCSVCMEPVKDKFGILPNCRHCHCLNCIMTWRKSVTVNKAARWGCPVCRVESPFVMPSEEWLEEGSQEKNLLIEKKKSLMAKQGCWYNSKGICPYSNCLYSHKVFRSRRNYENTVQYSSSSQWDGYYIEPYMPLYWMWFD